MYSFPFFSSQRDTDPCFVFLSVGRGRRTRQPISFILLSSSSRSIPFHTIRVKDHSASEHDLFCWNTQIWCSHLHIRNRLIWKTSRWNRKPVLFGMDELSSLLCSYNYMFKTHWTHRWREDSGKQIHSEFIDQTEGQFSFSSWAILLRMLQRMINGANSIPIEL